MPSGTSTQVPPLSPSLSQPYLGTPSHSPSLNSEVSDAEVENQRKKKTVKVIVSFIHQHLLALWAGGAEASRWPDGKVPDEGNLILSVGLRTCLNSLLFLRGTLHFVLLAT